MKCNQSRPGFELVSPCSFPTAITTTPRAPPCTIGWGCKIHQMNPCREVRFSRTSDLHSTLKKSDGEVPVMVECWEMQSTLSLPSLPVPLWLGVLAPDRVLSMGQIELNSVLMLNWIAWNRIILTFNQHTYAILNCSKQKFLHLNYVFMLNWIVLNETVCVCETELFEIELFLALKLYLR